MRNEHLRRALLLLGVLVILFLSRPWAQVENLAAQGPSDSMTPSFVSNFGGVGRGVAASGEDTSLYLGIGRHVVLLDKPAGENRLMQIGASQPLQGTVVALEREGGHLVAAGDVAPEGGGLWVLDLDDPRRPTTLGYFPLPEPIAQIALSGDRALLAGAESRAWMVSLSVPDQPQMLAELQLASRIVDVALEQDRVYVLHQNGLALFDLSDPSAPELIDEDAFQDAVDLDMDTDALVVATRDALRVYDRRHRDVMSLSSRFGFEDWPWMGFGRGPIAAIALHGNRVFVATGSVSRGGDDVVLPMSELHEIGLDDLGSPEYRKGDRRIRSLAPLSMASRGQHIYAIYSSGALEVFDAEGEPQDELTFLESVDSYDAGGRAGFTAATSGRAAFASDGSFRIIGLGDLEEPKPVGRFSLRDRAWKIRSANGAFVAIEHGFASSGIFVVDAETGRQRHHIMMRAEDLALRDDLLWILEYRRQLLVMDLDAEGGPEEVGGLEMDGEACQNIRLLDDLAIIGCYGGGLITLDISDPLEPKRLGRLDEPIGARGSMTDMIAEGELAYGLVQDRALIFDISLPQFPRLVNELDLPGSGFALVLDQRVERMYIATSAGLLEFDTKDPRSPRELQNLSQGIGASGVALTDRALVAGAGNSGLLIFDRGLPRPTPLTPSQTPPIPGTPPVTANAPDTTILLPWLSP